MGPISPAPCGLTGSSQVASGKSSWQRLIVCWLHRTATLCACAAGETVESSFITIALNSRLVERFGCALRGVKCPEVFQFALCVACAALNVCLGDMLLATAHRE